MLKIQKYILILLLVCSFNSSFAQYGIRLGLSASSFYYKDIGPTPNIGYEVDLRSYLGYDVEWIQLNDQKLLYAPYISVYRIFNLTNRFSFQPEISFTQKGVDFSQYEYEKIKYKIKINYLEIPLVLNFKFLDKEKVSSNLYFGGYTAIKLNAVKKIEMQDYENKSYLNNAKLFEYGINYGLTTKFSLLNQNFLIDLRAFTALSDALTIPDDQVKLYHEIQKVRNLGIYITIGYEL